MAPVDIIDFSFDEEVCPDEAEDTELVVSLSPKRKRRCHQPHRQQERRKQVSFAETTTVREIPRAKEELTKEEFASVYLSRRDLRMIRYENFATLELMVAYYEDDGDATIDTEYYCSRGLEGHLPINRRERYERIKCARKALMEEQSFSGWIHSDWIHSVYCELTSMSEDLAILKGFDDEDAAEVYITR